MGNVCCKREEIQATSKGDHDIDEDDEDEEKVPKVIPVVTQKEELAQAKTESKIRVHHLLITVSSRLAWTTQNT